VYDPALRHGPASADGRTAERLRGQIRLGSAVRLMWLVDGASDYGRSGERRARGLALSRPFVTGAIPQGRAVPVRSGDEVGHLHPKGFGDLRQVVQIDRLLPEQPYRDPLLADSQLPGELGLTDAAAGQDHADFFSHPLGQ
jgi:hypothetical protein